MMNDMDESYFDWSDEDDIICSSKYISSDEEDDDLAAIIAAKKQRTGESVFGNKKKQDKEDDFEKAMACELSQTMQMLTSTLGVQGSSAAVAATQEAGGSAKKEPEFYDDIYFDSDESDHEESPTGQSSKGTKRSSHRNHRHKVLSNDELFYDPTMDERDQEWVNQKRRSYQPRRKRPGRTLGVENNNSIQLPPSDAVLNCPACLTTLCMDCQRHEIYHNQYRAMFVFNCVVDVNERLSYPNKDQKKRDFIKNKKAARKNRKQTVQLENQEAAQGEQATTETSLDNPTTEPRVAESQSACQSTTTSSATTNPPPPLETPAGSHTHSSNKDVADTFHPVMCKICNTKVAVYDTDEVYHFFNVVTSY